MMNKESVSTTKTLPWEGRLSLFNFIKEYIKKDFDDFEGIDDFILPDKPLDTSDFDIYDEPGCRDWNNMLSDEVDMQLVKKLADVLEKYSKTGSINDKVELYNILVKDYVITYFTHLIDEIYSRQLPIEPFLLDLARWLVKESADRGPVKFGISLLMSAGDIDDLNTLMIIAMHDEFSFFAGYAIKEITENWDIILMRIAKNLRFWGRVQLVNILCYESDNPKVKSWLVREGFRSFYIPSLITLTCAQSGNLKNELLKKSIDKNLLEATQVILIDLLRHREVSESQYFTDMSEVVSLYLMHTLNKVYSKMQCAILKLILQYIEKQIQSDRYYVQIGWNEETCINLWIDLKQELNRKWYKRYIDYDWNELSTRAYDKICRI